MPSDKRYLVTVSKSWPMHFDEIFTKRWDCVIISRWSYEQDDCYTNDAGEDQDDQGDEDHDGSVP